MEQQQQLVQRAQQGDSEALAGLREQCQPALLNILLSRGASPTEAEEILADLWSECVSGGDRLPLLAKYTGKAAPLGWLARVAINRWIDARRRSAKFDSSTELDFDDLPSCPPTVPDDLQLQTALRESLRKAFAHCPGESILMLRLVYLHGLTQREIGRMTGWTESKTSRTLSQVMQHIEKQTLKELKKDHPHLELTWADFVALCASPDIDFL